MARHELWYTDPLGNKISYIPNASKFSYVMVSGDVGVAQFDTPLRGLNHEANTPDRRIHIYRQADGAAQRLEIVAFLDRFSYAHNRDGLGQFGAGASDPNVLLKRRINAFASGTSQSNYSGSFASNMMYQAAIRNLTEIFSAQPDRTIADHGFSVAAPISQGGSVNKQAAWKNTLDLLQEIQTLSKQQGQEIFFAIVPTSETAMQFQTYANQPGADRTLASGKTPVVFSLERGNLLAPQLTYDYSNEANYIYAGGKGQEDQRNVQEASDAASIGRSPFARKEKFVSAISGVLDNSDEQVLAKAKDALEKSRARVNLTGTIISTASLAYGKDWFFGDKVTIDYAGFQFDTIIRAVSVAVDGDGRETVTARVELSNE